MLLSKANTRVYLFEFMKKRRRQRKHHKTKSEQKTLKIQMYLHWAVTKKVEVHVFSKKVTLWMRSVKLLSSHEKMAGKIVSLGKENSNYII